MAKKKYVYIAEDGRTNIIVGVFSKRNKAEACIARKPEPQWYKLKVYLVK